MKPETQNLKRHPFFIGIICTCLVSFLVTGINAHAAETNDSNVEQSSGEADKQTPEEKTWEQLVPSAAHYDWIQLTSDEWLKGDLESMYEGKVEFDSDELDLLVLDWEDVAKVRGHGLHSIFIEGYGTITGVLQVDEEKTIVKKWDETREFPRNLVVSIAKGEPKESNYWAGKISLGVNVSKGNTDQEDYSTSANLQRRTSRTRLSLNYLGSNSLTRGIQTANSHRADGTYDVFKSRRYFLRPVFGEYYRDTFSNIAHRYTIGIGIGYHIIDTSRTEWDVTGGPAYQGTEFVSVEQGQNSTESTPALVVDTLYDTELNKRIDFILGYRFQLGNESSGGYTHHFVSTLESELTKVLDLDLSFVWDRTQNPTADETGNVPERDDYQFIVALAIDF